MQYRTLTDTLDDKGIPTFADLPEGHVPSFYSPNSGALWTDTAENAWVRVVTTPHGIFRAKVERDDYPEAPEFEAGDPIHRIPDTPYPSLGELVYGTDDDAGVDISHAWNRLYLGRGRRHAVELVDRYLRIFHGGAATEISSTIDRGGDTYLVWTTATQRRARGWTTTDLEGGVLPESLDGSEWQAYIDGDVYVISVEQLRADDEPEWETVDGPIHGFYSDEHALTSAEEELVSTIEYLSRDMLPLGGE